MRGCALPLPQPRMPRADHPAQSDLVLRSVQTRWCAGGGWRCASRPSRAMARNARRYGLAFRTAGRPSWAGPVPPGSFFGFSAEGCWPDCPPSVPSVVAVPPGSFFTFSVEDCWPEASVPSPCAAEPLEPGSATATAPPAPPISRPAASTQTPAAKRKCDRTTISSPGQRIARQQSNVATLSHGSTIGYTGIAN